MSCFWLKTFGVSGFMTLFFIGYFWILNCPVYDVSVMPLTVVDRLIPYHNSAWILYVSLWIYVQLPPMLIEKSRELCTYGATAALVSLVGFVIFFFWPTAVPALTIDGAVTSLARIRNLDATGNSCPSLHVAFAVFTAVWLEFFLRPARGARLARWLNLAWCLGIIYSTLGTKQHVFIDAIPGALLGLAGGLLQVKLVEWKPGISTGQQIPALAQINPAARKL